MKNEIKKQPTTIAGTIPRTELTPEIPPAWTVNQVLHLIPDDWRDFPIAILDSLNRPYPIKRVVLVVNRDGSRVIMIGPLQQDICKWA